MTWLPLVNEKENKKEGGEREWSDRAGYDPPEERERGAEEPKPAPSDFPEHIKQILLPPGFLARLKRRRAGREERDWCGICTLVAAFLASITVLGLFAELALGGARWFKGGWEHGHGSEPYGPGLVCPRNWWEDDERSRCLMNSPQPMGFPSAVVFCAVHGGRIARGPFAAEPTSPHWHIHNSSRSPAAGLLHGVARALCERPQVTGGRIYFPCPRGALKHGHECYVRSAEPATYDEAVDRCARRHGGRLTSDGMLPFREQRLWSPGDGARCPLATLFAGVRGDDCDHAHHFMCAVPKGAPPHPCAKSTLCGPNYCHLPGYNDTAVCVNIQGRDRRGTYIWTWRIQECLSKNFVFLGSPTRQIFAAGGDGTPETKYSANHCRMQSRCLTATIDRKTGRRHVDCRSCVPECKDPATAAPPSLAYAIQSLQNIIINASKH